MKKIKQVLLIAILLSSSLSLADAKESQLSKDISALSPTEASYLTKKLIAKSFYPLPESLITNLGFSFAWTGHLVDLKGLSSAGLQSASVLYGGITSVKYNYSDRLAIGVELGIGNRNFLVGNSNKSFDDTQISYSYLHGIAEYLIYHEHSLKIKASLGGGPFDGKYFSESFSETSGNFSRTIYKGNKFSYQAGIDARYYLNPIWSIGMGASYLAAKLDKINNFSGTSVTSPSEIDFSGVIIKASTAINL